MTSEIERNLRSKLTSLTEHWTHADWRKVRNVDYFSSDYMPIVQALIHKIDRIEYYNQHGVIMPYSPPKVQMFIDEMEEMINDSKSVLEATKKYKKDVTSITS
jgi:hypothetical protein